jgi:hypothetical protein
MRLALLVGVLLLTGCSSKKEPIPSQPDSPTEGGSIRKVGEAIENRAERVAAAVTVARDNADKPEVVRAETSVALASLPVPDEGHLAIAKARAAKADQKDYAAAEAAGKKAMADLDKAIAKSKADQAEAKKVSDMKDKRIEELERQLADSDGKLWTIAGIALVVIGGLIFWLLKDIKGAATVAGIGLMCGAYPQVMGSPWFMWIAIGSLAFCVGLAGWWAFDKVRDSVNRR